ncbi:MAG: hypothetical protein OEY14_11120, partial [Myxococcales bacterium]|nr:hypothetical protein [Myxococcales bacterium]
WVYVGIGCLVAVVLGCIVWGVACKMCASAVGDGAQRIGLSMKLTGIQFSCAADPSGQTAANQNFHPQAAASYAPIVCQVTDQTQSAFSDINRSSAENLSDTPDAGRATALGLDPDSCTLYTSGAARIVVCNVNNDLQFIHMENPGAVQ